MPWYNYNDDNFITYETATLSIKSGKANIMQYTVCQPEFPLPYHEAAYIVSSPEDCCCCTQLRVILRLPHIAVARTHTWIRQKYV